jgi:hypothetical protein
VRPKSSRKQDNRTRGPRLSVVAAQLAAARDEPAAVGACRTLRGSRRRGPRCSSWIPSRSRSFRRSGPDAAPSLNASVTVSWWPLRSPSDCGRLAPAATPQCLLPLTCWLARSVFLCSLPTRQGVRTVQQIRGIGEDEDTTPARVRALAPALALRPCLATACDQCGAGCRGRSISALVRQRPRVRCGSGPLGALLRPRGACDGRGWMPAVRTFKPECDAAVAGCGSCPSSQVASLALAEERRWWSGGPSST